MAEAITIARPYAAAIFDIARDKNATADWSALLAIFAQCAEDPAVQTAVSNPSVSDEQAVTLFSDIAGDLMIEDARHTLQLLAQNNRLLIMADIHTLFESMRAEAEQSITADVVSARPLTDAQKDKIAAALKQRLGRDVILEDSVDESLLGGAVIRAGDLVIDGSALEKLNRLASAIS